MFDSAYLRDFDITKVDLKAMLAQLDELKTTVSMLTSDAEALAKQLEYAVQKSKRNDDELLKQFSPLLDAYAERVKKFSQESTDFWKQVSSVQRHYSIRRGKKPECETEEEKTLDGNLDSLTHIGSKARTMKRCYEEFTSMIYHLRGQDKGLPVKLKWWSLTVYAEDLDKISDRILFVAHELSKLTGRNEF